MKHKVRPRLSPKKPSLRSLVDPRYINITGKYDPVIIRKLKLKLSQFT